MIPEPVRSAAQEQNEVAVLRETMASIQDLLGCEPGREVQEVLALKRRSIRRIQIIESIRRILDDLI